MKQKLLDKKYNEQGVNQYCSYVNKLKTEKHGPKSDKAGEIKNLWATYKKDDEWIELFEKINALGLCLDGEMITIDSTGIKLGYKAYKNLVLLRYPEAVFDIQLVKQGDDFTFRKENGRVIYSHKIADPFSDKAVVGGYCVLKLRTGEFLELLSLKELQKIKAKASSKNIWVEWENEMYLKSIIRRTCKRHCQDVVMELDKIDNESFNLEAEEVFVGQKEIDAIEELIITSGANKAAFVDKFLKLESLDKLLMKDFAGAVSALNKKTQLKQGAINANTQC